jgi:purine-binding chemotaxis protein CheW
LSIKHTDLTAAPKFGSSVDTSFIENVAEVDDNEVIMILNLKKIFEQDELVDIVKLDKQEEN